LVAVVQVKAQIQTQAQLFQAVAVLHLLLDMLDKVLAILEFLQHLHFRLMPF
jgi:hypothetical protein